MASGIPTSRFVSNLESRITRKYSNEREREGEEREGVKIEKRAILGLPGAIRK